MTTDELQALIGSLNEPHHAPGLATAAAGPGPLAPTLPAFEDPGAMAIAIARIAGESVGGASVVPMHGPELASPGFMPQLPEELRVPLFAADMPQQPPPLASPMVLDVPELPVAPPMPMPPMAMPEAPAPAPAPTLTPAPQSPSIPSLDGMDEQVAEGRRPVEVDGAALPWFPRVELIDSIHTTQSELPPWDQQLASVPIQDQITSALPPMGGVGAFLSPPGPPVIEGGGASVPVEIVRPSEREPFDPYAVRKDFPILEERVHGGKRVVWLDNAATTQKPRAVIDRLTYYYEHENSNVHRGAHALAARATDAFESARETTRKFLNAPSASEILFVRGATEGINLIAQSWGRQNIQSGDEIVLTHLEHHANIVPWQQLAQRTGARLRVAPVDDRGDVILDAYERLLCSRTKLVAFTQVSNALGTITPAREMIDAAHRHGATVLLDGAQAVSHMPVDVQALDCDFYVFSGHKVFAPTGIGAVFGKRAILDAMPPWQGGGNMIQDVTFERTVFQPPPWRFEAGTGNIADAAGMGAALDYVMRIGMPVIDQYEHGLLEYGTERLREVPGLHMVGTARNKAGVLSFVLEGQRTEDVGAALDKHGIAVRSGHHCAQPIHRRFGLEATVRASLAFYNVREDLDALVEALKELQSHRAGIR
jgi:cysteine desulfurase / selenocysteine lyase